MYENIKNGIYSVNYYGRFGEGFARFAFCDGEIYGTDVADAEYFGECRLNKATGLYNMRLSLKVPIGAKLVTDGRIRKFEETIPIEFSFSEDHLGRPLALNLPIGEVTITMQRLADLPTEEAAE